ncbi:MAG: hypothetical protein CSA55_03930 [Ilumatobacter coccineus]|uniref:Penicillin-binding protein 2 n=1 Tax=Ilumatobacter coccineus TaxID=467094 RepID=A0A2G6KBP4_9ACTN|nr:MAG: hypothetical protein CSA55_03930 [Ilumatobacter coccineus]
MAIDRRATRLGLLGLIGIAMFSLLGARLWFLQTVLTDELIEITQGSQTRTIRIPPERGRIFDADGRVLATNERILTVGIDWQMLRKDGQRAEIFRRLSGWVDVPVETMEARFQRQIDSPFLPFPIRQDIDEMTAIALLERIEDFPGLSVYPEWKRVYPYAPHAAHAVGYMGAIGADQLENYLDQGYLRNERIGQFGVERTYESVLHGTWGKRVIEVDAANRPLRIIEEVLPVNGRDIQLTIDLDIQQYVEQTLETTLRARRSQGVANRFVRNRFTNESERLDPEQPAWVNFKAPAGSAVVMNYLTGEVIAIASYPTYDNRWFEAGLTSERFHEVFPITDDPDLSILVNRAVTGRYNVGSTFKPFTAFAAMNSDLMTSGDYYTDTGRYELSEAAVSDRAKCRSGLIRCSFRNALPSSVNTPDVG